ncbi:hypothetical protein B0A49_07838 [Cryomyces minteri]|uniref:Uncharacterized protein n=1 Tax=Cryomyces minteri TaxID=331657 RepID=A0A4U0WST3_9PEZI|nr:hypothetical protein B0A49_07838 [Cryomyces minteri]
MDGREIPGYYFETKKYFKILPNHVAPRGAKYSEANVKEAKIESRKRKRAAAQEITQRRQLVQRARLLSSPLAGGIGLARETGPGHYPLRRLDAQSKAYGLGLEEKTYEQLSQDQYRKFTEADLVHQFAVDKSTSAVLLSYGRRLYISFPARVDTELELLEVAQTDIASVNISRTRTVILTTTGGGNRAPEVHLVHLLDPRFTTLHRPIVSDRATVFTSQDPFVNDSMWGNAPTAPNPFMASNSTDLIAVGGPQGMTLLTLDGSNSWQCEATLQTSSAILALDWLSPTTLAAGLRNSSVMLWDSRSRGHTARLQHPGAVFGLKRADQESRLVVCGLRNSMALYDLRMVRDSPSASQPRAKHGSKQARSPASAPVFAFSYANEHHLSRGFDVCPDAGLVAAADRDNVVQLYSLHTGDSIKRHGQAEGTCADDGPRFLEGAELTHRLERKPQSDIRCVRFIEDVLGRWKVLANKDRRIVQYSW